MSSWKPSLPRELTWREQGDSRNITVVCVSCNDNFRLLDLGPLRTLHLRQLFIQDCCRLRNYPTAVVGTLLCLPLLTHIDIERSTYPDDEQVLNVPEQCTHLVSFRFTPRWRRIPAAWEVIFDGDHANKLDGNDASPIRYVPQWWLSILDVTQRALQLLPALTLFYYSFLDSKDVELYEDYITEIMTPLNERERSSVKTKQAVLAKKFKTFTPEGKERKKRILQVLFVSRPSTLLAMRFFSAVLPSLRKYVTLFQTKSPMVHHLLTEQQTLLEDFLSLFVKTEAVKEMSEQSKRDQAKVPIIEQFSFLRKIDLTRKENLLPLHQMFLGQDVQKLLEVKVGKVNFVSDESKKTFLQNARKSFFAVGKVLQQKMPLDNKALKLCSALDPQRRCGSETREVLLQLPNFVPQLAQSDAFSQEVRSYSVSQTLPSEADCQIDQWWQNLKDRYPHLFHGACAMLSCFHGPIVESSFSAMGNIMDCHSARLSTEVFSAVQSVRHYIQARHTTALNLFAKKEPHSDPVNKQLLKNMQAAYKGNRHSQSIQRAQEDEKKSSLGVEKNPVRKPANEQNSKGCLKENSTTTKKDTTSTFSTASDRQVFF